MLDKSMIIYELLKKEFGVQKFINSKQQNYKSFPFIYENDALNIKDKYVIPREFNNIEFLIVLHDFRKMNRMYIVEYKIIN